MWCGVVWCGAAWFGVVWCGAVLWGVRGVCGGVSPWSITASGRCSSTTSTHRNKSATISADSKQAAPLVLIDGTSAALHVKSR